MADPIISTTIANLPAFSLPLAGTEKVPVDDGTTLRNVPASAIAALAVPTVLDASQPPYNGNIQAALNALPTSTGGTVRLPRGGWAVNPPLLVQTTNAVLVGDEAHGSTNLVNHYGAGPMVVCCGKGTGPTLVSALLSGTGSAWKLSADNGVNPGWFNLSEIYSCHLDGTAQFCAELIVQPSGVAGNNAALIASSGRKTTASAVTSAFELRMVAGGHPYAVLTVGGTQYALTGSSLTMQGGSTYHLALTYDGSTIRLFGGPSGGTCSLLASQAATGTVTQPVEEDVGLGRVLQGWPEGSGLIGPQDGCVIDSVRLSNVPRYTAPFTGATAKLPSDGNTLIRVNWDQFVADGGSVVSTTGPLTIGRNYNGNCYLAWKVTGQAAGPGNLRFRNLTFSGADVGLLLIGCTLHDLDNLYFSQCRGGVKAVNNSFNGYIRRITGDGDATTLAPSGQTCARVFLQYTGASTNCRFADCGTSFGGWAYPMFTAGTGIQIDQFRVTVSPVTVANMVLQGDGSGNNVALVNSLDVDDEPPQTPNGYVAGVILDSMDLVFFCGGGIDTSSSGAANVCVKVIGGNSITFQSVNFVGSAQPGNTSAVFASSPSPTNPIAYTGSVKRPSGLAWGS